MLLTFSKMSFNRQNLITSASCFIVTCLFFCGMYIEPKRAVVNPRLLRYFEQVSRTCQQGEPLILRFSKPFCPCIAYGLRGRVAPNTEALLELTWRDAERLVPQDHLKPGGQWKPPHCEPRRRLAVVIPYRDRERHLRAFLAHTHPILQKQLHEYRIFVVEQDYPYVFNKGSMMNIGYIEAQRMFKHDCILFHDVDLLMENDQHIMACGSHIQHIGAYVDVFGYAVLYSTLVGGAVLMSRPTFNDLNGYSNDYFGWGGEDDDFENRIKWQNKTMLRAPRNIASYTSLKHHRDTGNPEADDRRKAFKHRPDLYVRDGLNNLRYSIAQTVNYPLYTWIHARLEKSPSHATFFNKSVSYLVQKVGCSPEPEGERHELSQATCKFTCEQQTNCTGFYYRSDIVRESYCILLSKECPLVVPSTSEQIFKKDEIS